LKKGFKSEKDRKGKQWRRREEKKVKVSINHHRASEGYKRSRDGPIQSIKKGILALTQATQVSEDRQQKGAKKEE